MPEKNSISQNFDSFSDFRANDDLGSSREEGSIHRKLISIKRSITLSEKTEIPKESRVGKKLSELTTERVIILVLIMIIVLPFLDIQMYIEIDCYEYGLQLIDRYITTDNTGFFFY